MNGTAGSGDLVGTGGVGTGGAGNGGAGNGGVGSGSGANVGGSSSPVFDVTEHLLASAESSPSEAPPSGVPSTWNWVAAATSTLTSPPDGAYTHANYWGAVFRGQSDATPGNTQIELRNCSMWFLREGADQWVKTDASVDLGGSTFTPTYAGGGPEPLVLLQGPAGSDVVPAEGHIWHFWQGNGYQPVAGVVREIISNCQSRLALRNAGAEDDRAAADYLVHMGADWRNPSDPECVNDGYICPSWGVSKFERLSVAWRNHTFHSLTRADLSAGAPLPPASLFALPMN